MIKLFCKHDWKTIEKVETPSAFEQMAKCGLKSLKSLSSDGFDRKALIILSCVKCGQIKKYKM